MVPWSLRLSLVKSGVIERGLSQGTDGESTPFRFILPAPHDLLVHFFQPLILGKPVVETQRVQVGTATVLSHHSAASPNWK
jgi:hypothetical protein